MKEKRNHYYSRLSRTTKEMILRICRNGIRDVLRSRHHSYPLHLYYVTSLWSFDGNRNLERIVKDQGLFLSTMYSIFRTIVILWRLG